MIDGGQREKLIGRYPRVFGLRGFPGDRFRISVHDTFIADDKKSWRVYTERLMPDGKYVSFAKCSEEELRKEMVRFHEDE